MLKLFKKLDKELKLKKNKSTSYKSINLSLLINNDANFQFDYNF